MCILRLFKSIFTFEIAAHRGEQGAFLFAAAASSETEAKQKRRMVV